MHSTGWHACMGEVVRASQTLTSLSSSFFLPAFLEGASYYKSYFAIKLEWFVASNLTSSPKCGVSFNKGGGGGGGGGGAGRGAKKSVLIKEGFFLHIPCIHIKCRT